MHERRHYKARHHRWTAGNRILLAPIENACRQKSGFHFLFGVCLDGTINWQILARSERIAFPRTSVTPPDG